MIWSMILKRFLSSHLKNDSVEVKLSLVWLLPVLALMSWLPEWNSTKSSAISSLKFTSPTSHCCIGAHNGNGRCSGRQWWCLASLDGRLLVRRARRSDRLQRDCRTPRSQRINRSSCFAAEKLLSEVAGRRQKSLLVRQEGRRLVFQSRTSKRSPWTNRWPKSCWSHRDVQRSIRVPVADAERSNANRVLPKFLLKTSLFPDHSQMLSKLFPSFLCFSQTVVQC